MSNEVTKCENCRLLGYSNRIIGGFAHQTIESQHCTHPKRREVSKYIHWVDDPSILPEDCPLREEPFIIRLKENNDN